MLVNQSVTQGVFPDSAKIASVIPIFKKEVPSDKGNYRPILKHIKCVLKGVRKVLLESLTALLR